VYAETNLRRGESEYGIIERHRGTGALHEPTEKAARPPPKLAYEPLSRPDVLTVYEDDEQLEIIVPPAPRWRQTVMVIWFAVAASFISADILDHAGRTDGILRIVFDCIVLAVIGVVAQRSYVNLTFWTRLHVQDDRLVLQQYRHAVRVRLQWAHPEILHVRAQPRDANKAWQRPTTLQIELVGRSTIDILHHQPLADLERVASLLQSRILGEVSPHM
jgi:hypothetical protein